MKELKGIKGYASKIGDKIKSIECENKQLKEREAKSHVASKSHSRTKSRDHAIHTKIDINR